MDFLFGKVVEMLGRNVLGEARDFIRSKLPASAGVGSGDGGIGRSSGEVQPK